MTVDNEVFLRTIAENPSSDSPRLVFADWLEERGEGERAEFIRVQVELARARMPCYNPVLHEQHCAACALRARERELWYRIGLQLFASLRIGIPCAVETINETAIALKGTYGSLQWRRGLLARVSCTMEQWMGRECERCNDDRFLRQRGRRSGPIKTCPSCHRLGYLDAIGPAVVQAAVLEPDGVTFTDREPERHEPPQSLAWLYGTENFSWYRSDQRIITDLPDELFALLPDGIGTLKSDILRAYPSAAIAHAALSRAAIAWAWHERRGQTRQLSSV